MKLLHTADWHLGKRLYGRDRLDEAARALAEVAEVARAEEPDAIIVAGDLLDRRPVDAEPLGVCLDALAELSGIAPVIAVTGNHDDEAFWGHLGPWLAARDITLGHDFSGAPAAVRTIETGAGPLHAGLVPWPSPGDVEQPMGADSGSARRRYSEWAGERIGEVGAELERRREAAAGPTVLVGHLMISGARTGGGERELSLGPGSALAGDQLPDADYTALGHIHFPQDVPGAPGAARYAGSPLALDFSESTDPKGVVIAEIGEGGTQLREVILETSRPLIRLRGPIESLSAQAEEYPGALFSCEVETDGPAPDLARGVRAILPDAIRVEPIHRAPETDETDDPGRRDGDLEELYSEWYSREGLTLRRAQADALRDALEAAS